MCYIKKFKIQKNFKNTRVRDIISNFLFFKDILYAQLHPVFICLE